MKIMKKKIIFLSLIFILLFKVLIFSQSKYDRPIEGSCKAIVSYLIKEQGNDSIAIDRFISLYNIINDVDRKMLKKKYVEIIEYINSEEGKDCFCRSKVIIK